MLTFAWVVLVLSAVTLIWSILDILFGDPFDKKYKAICILQAIIWLFGCSCYIFDLNFVPFLPVSGIVLFATVLFWVFEIRKQAKQKYFELEIIDTTSLTAFAFFALAVQQSVWPNLIVF